MTPQRSASEERTVPGATHQPEAANLGVFRPPLIYLAALLLGVVLHLIFPISFIRAPVRVPLGILIALIAIALFVASVRTFRAAGTPVPGNLPTTTIVRNGPYRISRNPIYLAFSLLLLGIALAIGTIWLLIALAVAAGIMNFVVIPREERYLAARFPDDYLPYKASARRWAVDDPTGLTGI